MQKITTHHQLLRRKHSSIIQQITNYIFQTYSRQHRRNEPCSRSFISLSRRSHKIWFPITSAQLKQIVCHSCSRNVQSNFFCTICMQILHIHAIRKHKHSIQHFFFPWFTEHVFKCFSMFYRVFIWNCLKREFLRISFQMSKFYFKTCNYMIYLPRQRRIWIISCKRSSFHIPTKPIVYKKMSKMLGIRSTTTIS